MQHNNGRRTYTYLVSFGLAALLVFLVLALDTFGTDKEALPPLVQNADAATGYLICASVIIMLWGTFTFYRCTDSYVKRNLVIIDALLLLWMLAAIVCETANGFAILRYARYSFSVPLAFIPVLLLFNALHVSSLDLDRSWRIVRWTCAGISCVLVVLAFTNDLHGLYFEPDMATYSSLRFSPSPLQYVIVCWEVLTLAISGFCILVASRWRPRIVISIATILLGVILFLASVRIFHAYPLLDNNIAITYVVFIIAVTEICLHSGIIGANTGFAELFAKLPFDLKLLASDKDLLYRTQFKTDLATPLLAEEKEQLVKNGPRASKSVEFRISSVPNRMYRAYNIPGGTVLLSADSRTLSEETNRLEERQEMLKQQVMVLEQRNSLQQRLQRQKREHELFEDIEGSLRNATTAIQTIIASLPSADTPESREKRRQQLVLVKLLVAYCKRKGSLVLASKGGADFDRDRLMVIINEMVTDLRTAGAECAAIVEVDMPLSSYAVNQLYDCLYDFVTIAFQNPEPLIMIFVRTTGEGTVALRAQLEDSLGIGEMQTALATQLVDRLVANGIDHTLDCEENSLKLNVTLPVGEVR